jgi:D-tyrosyl-tRNA(Tyr) deacylase
VRILIQRVVSASVTVDERTVGEIGVGLLILVGVIAEDTEEDLEWLARKAVQLRIFDDAAGMMNRSVKEIGGEILAVSQFTLHASTQKGNRPSYSAAAPPNRARPLYEKFVSALTRELGKPVATGDFGAHMRVSLVNDGPVTIWLDSKRRE